LPPQSPLATTTLEQLLQELNQRIDLLEKSIQQKLQQHDKDLLENLRSIPGIGPKTAALLIVLARGFTTFSNHRQLISYLGLAPRIYQSGTSVKGSGSICKMGTGRIRAALFMCALQAKKCNPAYKALFDRLTVKGKPFKVALIAVINKLLKQVFPIAKSGLASQIPLQTA
jgi:transposase